MYKVEFSHPLVATSYNVNNAAATSPIPVAAPAIVPNVVAIPARPTPPPSPLNAGIRDPISGRPANALANGAASSVIALVVPLSFFRIPTKSFIPPVNEPSSGTFASEPSSSSYLAPVMAPTPNRLRVLPRKPDNFLVSRSASAASFKPPNRSVFRIMSSHKLLCSLPDRLLIRSLFSSDHASKSSFSVALL